MAKYVPDIRTQRWVIISSSRIFRPKDTTPSGKPPVNPFAEGNEALTPPEVYRIGDGEKNKPGWKVRVVPNKFPITDIHEVFIHSPDPLKNIEHLPLSHVELILTAYRDRYHAHADDGQVLIFCNQGIHAGASLTHPHSQLVVVPKQINLDALSREPINNVLKETESFVTYCPDFSQWPFEVWIAPKQDSGKFVDIKDAELKDLAGILQGVLQNIEAVYSDSLFGFNHPGVPFGYNYYIAHGNQWFIRVIPRFVHRAGFELGTGLNVNVVDPADAMKILHKKMQPQNSP